MVELTGSFILKLRACGVHLANNYYIFMLCLLIICEICAVQGNSYFSKNMCELLVLLLLKAE